VPHENGSLTLDVISHIAMPRLLFPDKAALPSDTEFMKKYTGLNYNWDENVSISIGNLGELYIDFGMIGGLIAEFLIGAIIAFVYRVIKDHSETSSIINAGLCLMIVLPAAYFGTAYIKLVGAFVFTSIIAIFSQRFIFERWQILVYKPRIFFS